MNKYYIVAIISFFENDIKQFKITAKNEFEAVKIGMIQFCKSEEAKGYELDYQNSKDYPKTIEELYYDEMDYSIIEISKF